MSNLSNLKVYSPTPLECTDYEGIRKALQDDGVAVVQGILTQEEQDLFLEYFWEAVMKRHRKLKRDDPSTWIEDNTDWLGTYGAGQYKHYGMAQEKHCWLIRQNQAIRDIFEKGVYASPENESEDCCVSLDGCAALFRPTVSKLVMHVDLVPDLPGSDWGSVQGAYNLYEVNADISTGKANAGFVCVVGSHRSYESMWAARKEDKKFKWPKKHWHELESDSPLQEEGSIITSPANSLVLWRSDLLHKNYGGNFTVEELGSESQPRLPRLTQFVTFSPKKFRTEQVLERKAQSIIDGCCNNHWAGLAFRVPIIPFPAWSASAKKIKVIRPFERFSPSDEFTELGEKDDEKECSEPLTKKRRSSSKMTAFEKLPKFVQDLI
jgi:hypothetical protein